MRRFTRSWENLDTADPVVRGIGIVAMMLLLIFALPYLPLPWITGGGSCTDMSESKVNGTNQSYLGALAGEDALRLEIVPNEITIQPGQPLQFDARLINNSPAALTLFMPANPFVLRYRPDDEDGLLINVIPVTTGVPLGESFNVRPASVAPNQFDPSQVRLLRPRQRCTITVMVDPARLSAAQVRAGQYRITAVYQNRKKGIVPPVGALTPTPTFPTQGVWTGRVQSNTLLLFVGNPPR